MAEDAGAKFIVLLCIVFCHCFRILTPFLSKLLVNLICPDDGRSASLWKEVQELKKEQQTVRMVDEFARYARLDRKIFKCEDEIKKNKQIRATRVMPVKLMLNVIFFVIPSVIVVYVLWLYRHVSMFTLPSNLVWPVSYLISLPSATEDGIGVVCWVLVCHHVILVLGQHMHFDDYLQERVLRLSRSETLPTPILVN